MRTFKKIIKIIIFVIIFAPCCLVAISNIVDDIHRKKLIKVRQYILTSVVIPINRYYDDNGEYPYDLDVLINKGYFNGWSHPNPFSISNKPIRDEPFDNSNAPGNFTYLPIKENHKITGYFIITYGKADRLDVDGDGKGDKVFDIIENGVWIPEPWARDRLPLIAKLLKDK